MRIWLLLFVAFVTGSIGALALCDRRTPESRSNPPRSTPRELPPGDFVGRPLARAELGNSELASAVDLARVGGTSTTSFRGYTVEPPTWGITQWPNSAENSPDAFANKLPPWTSLSGQSSEAVRPARLPPVVPAVPINVAAVAANGAKQGSSQAAGPPVSVTSAALALLPRLTKSARRAAQTATAAAAELADQDLARATVLASKGATFTAREKLESALHRIASALDAHFQVSAHEECLVLGLQALDEAADFSLPVVNARQMPDVAMIMARHRTSVSGDKQGLSAAEAAQRYCQFAERHLVAAAGQHPTASAALFALGKLSMHQAGRPTNSERANNLQAMALFRAALAVDEGNFWAANELGVLLARAGRWEEARDSFQLSVATRQLPETWQNLAIVHERLGEKQLAQQASLACQRLASATPREPSDIVTRNGTAVRFVDKSTFEQGGSSGVLR